MNKSALAFLFLGFWVASPQQPPGASGLPSVFVVGDSTAGNANRRGWADPFADYFDPSKVNVVNRARAGRSSRTFFTEGLWDRVLNDLKAGDFVLIQFGHNDGGPPDRDRARGSLPGIGDESREFTLPDGRTETVRTFGFYMRRFIADAKAKGATPVVLSLTVRNIWSNGHVERGSGQFGKWSAAIARSENVSFIDVTNAIADRYEALGPEKVKEFFPQDYAHTSPEGADLNASLVVAALKGLKDFPLAGYLSAKGKAVTPYPIPLNTDISRLRLPTPANAALPSLFLIGDSTVRNGRGDGSNGQWGWGEPLADLFDSGRINVVNRAVGGLSSRTYLTQGHWGRVLAMMKPGDFVIMQFGHNDSGPLDDAARARGTIAGAGGATKEIDNPITKQHEVVHTYGWYLKKFISDTRAKGARAIVCSPVPRKIWKDGRIARASESYGKWAEEAARAEGVPFVDLNEIIARRYDEIGQQKVEALFADPHTHTSRAGAELNAECVVAGLKSIEGDPFGRFLSRRPAGAAEFVAGEYGAKGDGTTVNTAAIQKAIDAAARAGGGTIVFRPGVYLSGAVFLKSHTNLRVDDGVEIRGVQDLSGYPILPTRVAGIEMKWPAALINVYEQSDVTISGKGIVDGDGKVWWDRYWKMRREDYEPRGVRWAVDYDCRRPRLIQIYKSSNVDLQGLTLKRSGFWTVHVCYSRKVNIDGITIRNNEGGHGPSTDGIDLDSSSDLLVQRCDIDCNDDAICLKAGRDADGLRVNKPSERIVIRDSTIRGGAAGVTFGSETSGGFQDVEVYGLHVLPGVPNGILFKSASTRGGTIRNIRIHDLDMQGVGSVFSVAFNWNPSYSYAKIPEGMKDYPDYWKTLTEPVPSGKGLPHLRDVQVSNIRATGAKQAFSVASYKDSPLLNVSFKGLEIDAKTAGTIRNADHWTFVDTIIRTADGSNIVLEDSRDVKGLAIK